MKKCNPPKYVRDYHEYKVKSKREFNNAYMRFPAGTVFTIGTEPTINKHLTAPACDHCGVQGMITVKGNRKYFESLFEWFEEGEQ